MDADLSRLIKNVVHGVDKEGYLWNDKQKNINN